MEPQAVKLVLTELEHEIFGKTFPVSLYGLDKHLGLDAVKLRQIGVQHDLLHSD